MIKSIISKLIILLIVLFSALSIFWFFKTSAIKKHITSLIKSSEGSVLASSVSVTGFPLSQKLSISDLRVKISPLNKTPNHLSIIKRDEYEIKIKKLEAIAGIFSEDFTAYVSGEISFQDANGVNSLKFNQPPKIYFSLDSGNISKFSYQDSGYKITDVAENVLFENGESVVVFESTLKGDKFYNKVQANFKDIGGLSFNNDIVGNISKTQESLELEKDSLPSFGMANNLVKKIIKLDIEFVSKNPSEVLPINSSLESQDNYEIVSIENGMTLESLKINNFEISSPLYTINVNGQINSFPKNDLPIGSVSLRIEKLDNILIYLRKYLASIGVSIDLKNEELANTQVKITAEDKVALSDGMSLQEVSIANSQVEKQEMPTDNVADESEKGSILDFVDAIRSLSKKNIATSEEVAVFDFRKEKDAGLLVNEISLIDVIMPMTNVNSRANIVPAKNEEEIIIEPEVSLDEITIDDINEVGEGIVPESKIGNKSPTLPASQNRVIQKTTKDEAPIPNPVKIEIPAKPVNAN